MNKNKNKNLLKTLTHGVICGGPANERGTDVIAAHENLRFCLEFDGDGFYIVVQAQFSESPLFATWFTGFVFRVSYRVIWI